jgi:hypothetical protein
MDTKHPKTSELLAAIAVWSRPLIGHPAFGQLARAKIGSAFDWEDDFPERNDRIREVVLPEPLATQHDAVMRFYNLWTAAERLKQVEFYFRCYPFRNGQVDHHEHLENICGMFFGGFYIFEERLKVYLTVLNKASSPRRIDVGRALKLYRNRFKIELRQRHDGTHVEPFDDVSIQAVMLRGIREQYSDPRNRRVVTNAYRKASREWAGRAKSRAANVASFLEGVAAATLDIAIFLQTPPSPSELKFR